MSVDALNAEVFQPHTGSEFRVATPDGPQRDGPQDDGRDGAAIRLDEVTRRPAQAGAPRADPFTLEFTGPPPVLEQRIHTLDHPILGTLELFLVPIGIDPDGRVRYEAVFN